MMHPRFKITTVVLAMAQLLVFAGTSASGQVIVADDFNVTGSGTGFGLNAGVNTGINPPATRLTGSATANLRYIATATSTKATTAFSIAANKLRTTALANPGRFTLSANGSTPFDFGPALGATTASPTNPVVYDLAIRMANSTPGVQRFSFALAVAEGDATTWDFGIQVFHTAASDNFYTIGKRIDIAAAGVAADINSFITNTAPGTYGTEVGFLIRVTDAGAETTGYHSRVQVSMDNGVTWIYDTATDPDLPNGWRLDGPGRYILWDVAPDAGNVTYDNFSIRMVPVSAALVSPADGAVNLGASPNLTATVSNTLPDAVNVTFYGHEVGKPYPGPDFLIPVLPDTQNYAREAAGSGTAVRGMWYAQTEWIITNRVSRNIAYVSQLGDIVQNGDILSGSPNDNEWEIATNAMYRLESPSRTLLPQGIPYGCAVGNHDQEPNGDLDGTTTHYNLYFGTPHFAGKKYYGGHYSSNNDNHFDLFSVSGLDFIVFYFEYDRYGATVLDWANDVLATNQNRRVIVATHHAGSDNTPSSHSAQGAAIYAGLKANTNFFLMLGGHVFANGGEGSRSDTFNGRTMRTLVSDYQGRFNGGNGLMRLMYFSPSNNLVSIKTYSPYTDTFETDADSQFTFSYNMQLPTGAGTPGTAYAAIGTNTNVPPGTQTSFAWSGLQPNKTYEWYAVVTDAAGGTVTTGARRFTTTVNSAPLASNVVVTVVGDQPTQVTLQGFDANGDALTFRTNTQPIRGLNSNFNPTTGTLTYSPARGYRGLDRFTFVANDGFADSAPANFDLNVTAPADSNTNGLPDAWEAQYGVTDPAADADGDGQSNLAEYFANTNPTNSASVFQIVGTVQTNGAFVLTWSAVGGSRYRLQYSDTDASGPFTDVFQPVALEMNASPYGAAATQAFTDNYTLTGVPANGARYYRIKVVP